MRRFYRVPTIYVLSKNMKNIIFFSSKNIIFRVFKNSSILHGYVCVMLTFLTWFKGNFVNILRVRFRVIKIPLFS